jgi:aminoglycoside phosphotransferase (APT) family kinase protein
MQMMDRTTTVRAGEEISVSQLEEYLRACFHEEKGTASIRQFGGGASNLTYLVRFGSRDIVLRRPPFGSQVKTAHDMGREYRVLSNLHKAYSLAPKVLAYCEDDTVLGAPFYLMEPIDGLILSPGAEIPISQARGMCESFIDNLAALHAVNFVAAGLGDLGKPQGYVERQVKGWIKRYSGSQIDDLPAVPQLSDWLVAHIPSDSSAALIHNDYHLGNVVLDPRDISRVIGVLDWEMCTLGDPLMDLGTSLSYWIEPEDPKEMQRLGGIMPIVPGILSRREFAERYAEQSGRPLKDIVFYYAVGLFKTAVIVQQIYYRFQQGHTRDPRFAGYFEIAKALIDAAVRTAENGQV